MATNGKTKAKGSKMTDLVRTEENTGLVYYDINYNPKPIGGEFDDDEDFRIKLPKMKLLSALSNELKSKESRVEGAEPGCFFNTTTREIFDDIEIVPLFKFVERFYNNPPNSANLVCTSKDGRGKWGLCGTGEYSRNGIPTKMITSPIDGAKQEMGFCKGCPKSMRSFDKKAECEKVILLVCVHKELFKNEAKLIKMIQNEDPTVALEILQNIFTLSFKSTSLKKFDIIQQTIGITGMYFSQSWKISSFEDSNSDYHWQNYVINSGKALTDKEKSLALTITRFAQKIRQILVITDIEEVPDEYSNKEIEDTPTTFN